MGLQRGSGSPKSQAREKTSSSGECGRTLLQLSSVSSGLCYFVISDTVSLTSIRTWIPSATALSTFLCYTLLAGEKLTVSKAFTAIALFSYLQEPMTALPGQVFALLHGTNSFTTSSAMNLGNLPCASHSICLNAEDRCIP